MLHLLIQTCAAAMATIGFSLLFGVPARYYPSCALIGGVSWLAYLLLLPYSSAVRKRCPVTIFLISGIIPLVPGAGIYRAAYYTVTDQLYLAVQTGFDAVKMAVAIVLGIVFVFEIPQTVFQIGNHKAHQKH